MTSSASTPTVLTQNPQLGRTDGAAIPAGYIGEVLDGAATGAAISTSEADVVTKTLTNGVWLVSGGVYFSGGSGFTGASLFSYAKGVYLNVAGKGFLRSSIPSSQYLSLTITPVVVVIGPSDSDKTFKLRATALAATATADGYIHAVRIA